MYLHNNTPFLSTRDVLTSMKLPLSTVFNSEFMAQHGITKLKTIFPALANEKWQEHDADLSNAALDVENKTITPGIKNIRQYALVVESTVQELTTEVPTVSNDHEDVNWLPVAFELNGWIEPGWQYDDDAETFVPVSLKAVKDEAIRRISDKANGYQRQIIGTEDADRAKRFEMNLKAAKSLLAGIANEAQTSMLQLQLDANEFAGHSLIKDMTLEQFAGWIVSYDDIATKAIGLIENVLIVGRAQVNNAGSVEEIDAIIKQLAKQAEEQFQLLVAGGA